MLDFDITNIDTPYYIVDERLLIKNLQTLKQIKIRTGVKILLAQKAFAMYKFYPLISEYLDGTTASGLFEARLGYEEMGKETHIFAPAYKEIDFAEIMNICDHIIFNSFTQWEKYGQRTVLAGKSCGIRINPQLSTQEHGIYDPCSEGSRLGVTIANFPDILPQGIDGLHFHTLCEQNADALAAILEAVEEKFGRYLYDMKWLNFGGGHHITRADYDIDLLCSCIERMRTKYGLEIYIEPGEAVALNTGYLVTTVEDIVDNEIQIAILDTSAACHMPDVLEMPYKPPLLNSGSGYDYRLGTITCLAGDIIGDYSFDAPLKVGDRLVFGDMAHYSMVKNNMFNGINLPSIYKVDTNGNVILIKSFGYNDYKERLS